MARFRTRIFAFTRFHVWICLPRHSITSLLIFPFRNPPDGSKGCQGTFVVQIAFPRLPEAEEGCDSSCVLNPLYNPSPIITPDFTSCMQSRCDFHLTVQITGCRPFRHSFLFLTLIHSLPFMRHVLGLRPRLSRFLFAAPFRP